MILKTNQTLIRKPQTGNQTLATFTCCIYNCTILSFKVLGGSLLITMKPVAPLFRFCPPFSCEIVCFLSCPRHSSDSTSNALLIYKKRKKSKSVSKSSVIWFQPHVSGAYSCCTKTLQLYISIFQSSRPKMHLVWHLKLRPIEKH